MAHHRAELTVRPTDSVRPSPTDHGADHAFAPGEKPSQKTIGLEISEAIRSTHREGFEPPSHSAETSSAMTAKTAHSVGRCQTARRDRVEGRQRMPRALTD